MTDSFKEKYLKYKSKYLKQKNMTQVGGCYHPTQDMVTELLKLYYNYYEHVLGNIPDDTVRTNLKISLDFDNTKIYNGLPLFDLDIEYTIEQIKYYYDKYGIIVLRNPFASKKLLLGCGNKPLEHGNFDSGIHAHNGYITINPEITMNPTIIGAFGVDDGIKQLYLDIGFKFNEIIGEAVTIYVVENSPVTEKLKLTLDTVMIPDYKVGEIDYKIDYVPDKKGFDAFTNSYMFGVKE